MRCILYFYHVHLPVLCLHLISFPMENIVFNFSQEKFMTNRQWIFELKRRTYKTKRRKNAGKSAKNAQVPIKYVYAVKNK